MQFRQFGKLGIKVSALGFGAMRLPVIAGDYSKIDEKSAIEMIRCAIDNGVNYVDTAWGYHGGNSELVVGKALQDGYREKTYLATKLPSWLIKKEEDMDHYLNEQLKKLGTDHIDFYLLHGLNRSRWENYKKLNVFGWIEKVKAEGKIKHIGFSFHDDYDVFKDIIDDYDKWDFCQIQYNYMDAKIQAGERGLKYAAGKGLAVVIMEPIRGGRLAGQPPKQVMDLWNSAENKKTPAEWALEWLWNQKEVSVVLSGMSTMEQVKQNLGYADKSGINSLNGEELKLVERVRGTYKKLQPVPCTGCNYCMPCPNGVNIPRNFSLYNESHMFNVLDDYKNEYNHLNEAKASSCASCGNCESACPQKLSIIDLLKNVAAYFE